MKTYASSLVLLLLALGIGAYLWRERNKPALPPGTVALLQTDPQKVRSVEVALGERKLSLQRGASGDQWRVLGEGKNVPADPERVRSLLGSLQMVQASTSGDLTRERDYGLIPPRATLTLTTNEGRTQLEFGNLSLVSRDLIYARANGIVGLVSTAPLQKAVGSFDAWRDRAILRFDPQAVTQFKVKWDAVNTAFQKQGDGGRNFWRIIAPVRARADTGSANTFLRALASALFVGGDSVTLPASAALRGEVGVQTAEGQRTLKVFAASGTKTRVRWLGRNTAGSTFVLPPAMLALLNRPLFTWRDKSVLPFRIGGVGRLQIAYGGVTQVWQRDGAAWFKGNEKSTVVESKVRDALLDTMLAAQNLRATRFAALKAEQKSRLIPSVELHLDDQVVRVGREDGHFWATSSVLPDAAQLAPADFSVLQTAVERLFPTAQPSRPHNPAQNTGRSKDTS